MKQEQLLQAIGSIDEELLRPAPRRPFRAAWRVALLAAILATVTLSAAAFGTWTFKSGSNTMANTLTSEGRFAYFDGWYYCGTERGLFRQHARTLKVEKLPLPEEQTDPRFLVMTDIGLGFVTAQDTFVIQTEHGNEQIDLPEGSHLCRVYGEGSCLYTNNGAEFSRIDLNTGEKTVLLTDVHCYFVDENWIYALVEGNCFLRSPKDNIAFETISLSFQPAEMLAHGDTLYFTKFLGSGNRYRIISYRDGIETKLPIVGFGLQMYGERLLYLDRQTLMVYDPATGSNTLFAENVYEYAVLNGDCVCICHYGGDITVGGHTFHAAYAKKIP